MRVVFELIGVVLSSQVSEFSPSTSSAMGLPKEFHEQCRRSLELDYLKVCFTFTHSVCHYKICIFFRLIQLLLGEF